MIQTICIGDLLQAELATPFRRLLTRPTGAAIRGRIERALAGSVCLTALLDFSDIELLDLSCADEVVAKLLMAVRDRAEQYVALFGLSEDQHEAIEHVLTHHHLAIAAVPPGRSAPRLLGWVPADARHAFTCLCTWGPLHPIGLARALGWSENRAATSLEDLTLLRLTRLAAGLYHPLPLA
ncbi:MAG: hypothetical protein H0W67_05905 [Gemmatimonadales bacterium]|nr:hypothetical protein [Gemmatimonadales bacterium]